MNYNQLLSTMWAIVSIWFYDPVALDHPSGVCEDRVKQAHYYHGILISQETWKSGKSESFFFRKSGKSGSLVKCKLYTKGFKQWEKKNGTFQKPAIIKE